MKTKFDLEEDLLACRQLCVQALDTQFAGQLYVGLCNNDFRKREMWPMLTDTLWHCSWRHAGGIVAAMRMSVTVTSGELEDYVNWYCSNLAMDYDSDTTTNLKEGEITATVAQALNMLGWGMRNSSVMNTEIFAPDRCEADDRGQHVICCCEDCDNKFYKHCQWCCKALSAEQIARLNIKES